MQDVATTPLTKGEEMVRTNFNVSGNTAVDEVKTLYAKMINDLDEKAKAANLREDKDANWKARTGREFSRAITAAEDACMLAVKALTA